MMSSQGLSEYLSEQYLEKQNPCLSLHMSSPHLTFGLGIKSLPRTGTAGNSLSTFQHTSHALSSRLICLGMML